MEGWSNGNFTTLGACKLNLFIYISSEYFQVNINGIQVKVLVVRCAGVNITGSSF